MSEEDHATELSFLTRRYPDWTIWFGPSTKHWWALPPRDHDIGDFVEAETVQHLVVHIESIRTKPPAHRDDPSSILRLGAPPIRRVPLATRPGDPAR
ncbi:hypothetical protein [Actinocorallia longicatena]